MKEIGISSCYEHKFYYDYIYTDECINLTSLVESCWAGNLRILHSPLTTGEWTGTQARDCHAPRLSGLPKIHKDRVPLRGVVSTAGSQYEKISRYLIPILRTKQGRNGLFVKTSRELKEKFKDWRVERNKILVSYDVKNVYPSIPINKALELVEKLLRESRTQGKVTELSVDSIMELL